MSGTGAGPRSDAGATGCRGVAWLRLAGEVLAVLTMSYWLLVLEAVAPPLAILLIVPCVALPGPAWTYPKEGGIGLVLLAGTVELLLVRAVGHPFLAEVTLVVPIGCAGLLLLCDALLHPTLRPT
jgi:hypothetical protein